MILQWKDHSDVEVGAALSLHLASLVQRVATRDVVFREAIGENAIRTRVIAVIPAPSSAKSRARRGRLQTHELACAVAEVLRDEGINVRVIEGLAMSRVRGKAVQTHGVRSRQMRSHGGMSVATHRFPAECCDAVIVDDICTTGSTLLSCARALHEEGIRTVAAFSLASVPDDADE